MKNMRFGAIACAIGALVVGCSGGDNRNGDTLNMAGAVDTSAGAVANSGMQMSDANILSVIATINGAEIKDAQTAQQKASSKQVKDFAQQMITDHRAMQGSLDSLAKAKNLSPETGPTADSLQSATSAQADSLSKLSGKQFDQAYISAQVTAHQQAVDMLTRMSSSAQDPDLKNAIQQAIPKVQSHLDRARSLQQSLGTAS
jgi:putative membrane protein